MEEHAETTGLIEKAFLMGLGAASLAKETITDLVDDLVARGRVKESDAADVAAWMSRKAAEQTETVRGMVAEQVQTAIAKAGLATKADIQRLEAEIWALREQSAANVATADEYVP